MEEKQQETADKKTLRQEIPVYSEKYGVHGKVLDYGVVTKLVFNYDVILSILVDTFISKISLTMQPGPKIDSISGA